MRKGGTRKIKSRKNKSGKNRKNKSGKIWGGANASYSLNDNQSRLLTFLREEAYPGDQDISRLTLSAKTNKSDLLRLIDNLLVKKRNAELALRGDAGMELQRAQTVLVGAEQYLGYLKMVFKDLLTDDEFKNFFPQEVFKLGQIHLDDIESIIQSPDTESLKSVAERAKTDKRALMELITDLHRLQISDTTSIDKRERIHDRLEQLRKDFKDVLTLNERRSVFIIC
jgi:hypothetical protein